MLQEELVCNLLPKANITWFEWNIIENNSSVFIENKTPNAWWLDNCNSCFWVFQTYIQIQQPGEKDNSQLWEVMD